MGGGGGKAAPLGQHELGKPDSPRTGRADGHTLDTRQRALRASIIRGKALGIANHRKISSEHGVADRNGRSIDHGLMGI